MRYRYIFNGGVKANDKISDYRLLDKQKMQGENDVIRVEIPEDIKLEKWACDEYSTWDSSNERDFLVSELNPQICVKINGQWNVLEDATSEWLGGEKKKVAIQKSIKEKYHQVPVYNIGYLTTAQYRWYWGKNNTKYSWRFDRLPSDLFNIKIPALTPSQLETLDFVREKFKEYFEEAIEKSLHYNKDEKEEAKEFFKEWIEYTSNDDLAYEWHRYSITSLDPYKKFETKELVDKMKKSKYCFVYGDHYKHAIKEIVDNLSFKYDLEKYKDNDNERRFTNRVSKDNDLER